MTKDLSAAAQLSVQPAARYLVEPGEEVAYDSAGFLRPEFLRRAIRPRQLLEEGAWVVQGVPTVGKSRLMDLLHQFALTSDSFRIGANPTAAFEYGAYTNLANPDHARNLTPSWFNRWVAEGVRPALWIVDALDEGQLVVPGIGFQLLDLLKKIPEQRLKSLRFVVSARANEVEPAVVDGLKNLLGATVVELLPLDAQEARTLVPDAATFAEVQRILSRADMRAVAGLPLAIRALGAEVASGQGGPWTQARVWHALLRHLVVAPFRRPHRDLAVPPDAILDAAKRIAFVMTFATEDELLPDTALTGPTVGRLCNQASLFEAGRQLLHTNLMAPGARGHRFWQRHIREWLSAFAMQDLARMGAPEKLKPVLLDPTGAVAGGHRSLAGILLTLEGNDFDWVRAALQRTDDKSLDDILAAAAQSPFAIRIPAHAVDPNATAKRLRFWLRAPNLTEVQQYAVLDLAADSDDRLVSELLLEWALDVRRPIQIRRRAVLELPQRISPGRLDRLRSILEEATDDSNEGGRALRAAVLRLLLEAALMSARDVVDRMPTLNQTIDATWMLVSALRERLDATAAAHLLELYVAGRFPVEKRHSMVELIEAAVGKMAATSTDESAALLVRAIQHASLGDEYDVEQAIEKRIGESSFARRHVFEIATRPENAEARWTYRVAFLRDDDLPWLEHRIRKEVRVGDVRELLRLSRRSEPSTRESARALVQARAPELLKQFDDAVAKHDAMLEDREDRLRARKSVRLEVAVRDTLDRPPRTPDGRFWVLGWLCFSKFRPDNIRGTFSELGPDLQARVFDWLEDHVRTAEPTRVPATSIYPASIHSEEAALEALWKSRPQSGWLTAKVASRWMRTVLKVSNSEEEFVRAFAHAAPDVFATEAVWFVEAEVKGGAEHCTHASVVPKDAWPGDFAQRALALVEGEEKGTPTAKTELLRTVTVHALPDALPVVERLACCPDHPLSSVALALSLAVSPEFALPIVEAADLKRQEAVLEHFASHVERFGQPRVDPTTWSHDLQERLARLLYQRIPARPEESDRIGTTAHWVTPADELRDVRTQILNGLLLKAPTDPLSAAAIKRLQQQVPGLSERIEHRYAVHAAHQAVLQGTTAVVPISCEELLRLLDSLEYRLCRNSRELTDVVIEQLEGWSGRTSWDLHLLYDSEGLTSAIHRSEKTLQTYLRMRLNDILPGRVIDREAWRPYGKFGDLRIVTQRDGLTSQVVIEVKWSDNDEVRTALAKQLCDRYLDNDADLEAGVLLVAWMGKAAGLQRDVTTSAQLLRFLQAQAAAEAHSRPKKYIRVCVIDLEWKDEVKGAKKKAKQ